MSNPARPVSGNVIDTVWGLNVADAVVRTYPNAASRDADLTGFTSADLLGQVVHLQDTGALLVYNGPTVQWTPPWNVAWGAHAHAINTTLNVTVGTTGGPVLSLAVPTAKPGRQWRITATLQLINGSGATADLSASMNVNASSQPMGIRHLGALEIQTYVYEAYMGSVAGTPTVHLDMVASGATALAQGYGTLSIDDVGPLSAPSDLE